MMPSMPESKVSNHIDPREAIEYFAHSSKKKNPDKIAKVCSRIVSSIYEIMDKKK